MQTGNLTFWSRYEDSSPVRPIVNSSYQVVNRTLAIDADGVLLDYNYAYAQAWKKAFGHFPKLRSVEATHAFEHWDVPVLVGSDLKHLQSFFDGDFWSSMPAMTGALDACNQLVDAGYELVCVTALHIQFQEARASNLRMLGLPIANVYATGTSTKDNPKLNTLLALKPLAFVDDHEPYFQGVPDTVHRAFIGNRDHDLPMDFADSSHADLGSFAQAWLQKGPAP